LGAALDFRNLIGQERIEKRVFALKHYLLGLLEKDERFVVKTPGADDLSGGIQTVEVVGKQVGDVRNALRDDHGIDCRPMSGHGINGVRLSLAIYCTKADVDKLVQALGA
jgi:selenocysteine lyase/cysteine desulfurase